MQKANTAGKPIHDRAALASFQDGEERLVYARYQNDSTASAYYLEQGTARDPAVKDLTRNRLRCIVPRCPQPALTAVDRSSNLGRRDGFRHGKGAGGHGAEGLFHQQAKVLIQAWVRRQFPEVVANLEEPSSDGSRRADVMLTWPTGKQAAVEIQYAALTVAAWEERNASYAAQGITAIWLFGHNGAHLKTRTVPSGDSLVVEISLLHQRVLARGSALLWINPIDRSIATPWTELTVPGSPDTYPIRCKPNATTALAAVDRLDSCELDPERGIITPTTGLLAASEQEYLRIQAAERALRTEREVEAEKQRAKDRAIEAEARAARDAQEAQRRAEIAELRENAKRGRPDARLIWLESDLRLAIQSRYGGDIPIELDSDLPHEHAIFAHPTHWRCLLYDQLIKDRPRGWVVAAEDCLRVLDEHKIATDPDPGVTQAAIGTFFLHLRDHGIVRRHGINPRRLVSVVQDIDQKRARVEAKRTRVTDDRNVSTRNRTPTARPQPSRASPDDVLLCEACGLPLNPCLRGGMRHAGPCEFA